MTLVGTVTRFCALALVLIASFAISSCGGSSRASKIDASNADAVRESLATITADMTEAERQSFGQDILTVYSGAVSPIERLNAYPKSYARAFSDPSLAQDIALEHFDLFDGKTPADLALAAFVLRKENAVALLESERDEIAGLLAYMENATACIDRLVSEGKARGETGEVAAFSQTPTDPLHMRNLLRQQESCRNVKPEVEAALKAYDGAIRAAKNHDYAEPFDASDLPTRVGGGCYPNGILDRPRERACGTTFQVD